MTTASSPLPPSRLRSRTIKLASFAAGQGLTQAASLLAGLLIVRWLTVSDYAQYSLSLSFQSTIGVVVDSGIGVAIVSLIGDRIGDPIVVASYVRAAQRARLGIFLPIALVAPPAYWLIASRHNWPGLNTVAISISVLLFVLAQVRSLLSVPLLLAGHLRHYYSAQVAGAICRLGVVAVLHLTGSLNCVTAALTGVLASLVTGQMYAHYTRGFFSGIARSVGRDAVKAIRRYVRPLVPSTAYSAFQGQISLFIVAIFASSSQVGQVGALSRLQQLLLIASAANVTLLEPMIARSAREHSLRIWVAVVSLGALLVATSLSLALLFPTQLLWILGGNYSDQRRALPLTMLSAAVSVCVGFMWTLNNGKRYLFEWQSFAAVGVSVLAQVACACWADLSTVQGAMAMALSGGLGILAVYLVVSIVGLVQGPRDRQSVDQMVLTTQSAGYVPNRDWSA